MTHEALITQFYESFKKKDAEGMVACYHPEIQFQDPAFGKLNGADAGNMWRMLLSRGDNKLEMEFNNVKASGNSGAADWKATYLYGPDKRKVINRIHANFEFKDGKIIKHVDEFDLWKWTRQALGWKGYLLGWTPFMRSKIHQQTNSLLRKFSATR